MGQHTSLVLVAYLQKPPLNAHSDVSRIATGRNLGRNFHLLQYFVYAKSQGFGKTAHMCRLV